MSINRRHIIQYKPEGVANIFAPTIRINGQYVNTPMGPSASNGLDFNHVQYPQQSTISASRSSAQQQNLTNQGFNQIYHHLFSNLMNTEDSSSTASSGPSESSGPSATSADSSSSYGLGSQTFDSDLARFFSQSLAPQLNCLNSGGICKPSTQCTGKNLGKCNIPDMPNSICCDEESIPEASNDDSSFQNTYSIH